MLLTRLNADVNEMIRYKPQHYVCTCESMDMLFIYIDLYFGEGLFVIFSNENYLTQVFLEIRKILN